MRDESGHILIVEDSATQAMQLRHLLLRHFPRVTIAAHGVEALPILRRDRPAIVISDVNMPEMDGYDLCRCIKAEPELANIPVILITSLIDARDVMKGLECGASGFLSKPYQENHLVARIRFLLANPELRAPVRAAAGLEVTLEGEPYFVTAERSQMLAFLLSTYELALNKNKELGLATDALAAQARELERSNAELEQFAYVASHDLQEPLRMIASYLGLLERRAGEKLEAKEKEYIGFAVDGAQRMQRMINDLLAFSRVSTHGRDLGEVDLEKLLRDALRNLEVAIHERGAAVTHDLMPTAKVDASQLTQLFQNLIGNALKFCRDRPPVVHVGCVRQSPAEWLFSVRDNGIGIEPQDFERIFQLFQRLHGRGEYPGSGIGLAVCKKIVERHGGRIWPESEPGKGTTFYFTLPA